MPGDSLRLTSGQGFLEAFPELGTETAGTAGHGYEAGGLFSLESSPAGTRSFRRNS